MPLPPADLLIDGLLYAVLAPALATAVLQALLLWWFGKRFALPAGALAVAVGVPLGLSLRGAVSLFPGDYAHDWLPWTALLALVVGLLTRIPGMPVGPAWLLRVAVAEVAAGLLLPADLRASVPWMPGAFVLVVLAEWLVLEEACRTPGGEAAVGTAVVFLAGAVVLLQAHSGSLCDAAAVAAAGLLGVAVVTWWFQADAGGPMPGVAVFLPGLMIAGRTQTFSEVPAVCFALVALAPLLLGLTLLPPAARRPRAARLLRAVLVLAVIGVAVGLAMAAEPPSGE